MAKIGRGLVSKTKKKVESTCRLMPEIFSDLHSHIHTRVNKQSHFCNAMDEIQVC